MEKPSRDQMIGETLTRLRGERSQQWLADAMREAGFRWAQATVWNVEKGERPLRLAEAEAVSRILEVDVADLLSLPTVRTFFDALADVQEAENGMLYAAALLDERLGELARSTDELGLDASSRAAQLGAAFRFDLSPMERLAERWRGQRAGDPTLGPATAEYLRRPDLQVPRSDDHGEHQAEA